MNDAFMVYTLGEVFIITPHVKSNNNRISYKKREKKIALFSHELYSNYIDLPSNFGLYTLAPLNPQKDLYRVLLTCAFRVHISKLF